MIVKCMDRSFPVVIEAWAMLVVGFLLGYAAHKAIYNSR